MQVKKVTNEQEYRDAVAVRRKVFIDEQRVPEDLELDEYEDTATHFVAYDEERAVGAGRCRLLNGRCKIERICVLPDCRKKGIGIAIMAAIEQFASEKQWNELKLNSQTHAEKFYKRLGFETTSGEFLDAGIPHVTMLKKI